MSLIRQQPSFRRQWALPIVILAAAALFTFWGLYSLDALATTSPDGEGPGVLERYLSFDPESLTDAYAALATLLAAVFGIVITVVSIIVQLSSDRYTGVARLFLRDRVNLAVMGFYVVGCVTAVWLSLSLKADYVPRIMTTVQLLITTVGLVIMAPYFGYVFWFLDPLNIVERLRRQALKTARRGAQAGAPDERAAAQLSILNGLEELTDITINSVSGKDKIIASAAVDALKELTLEYLSWKPEARPDWFQIGPGVRMNPDFVAMDPEVLRDLEARRTWVEWKVMRQYLGIFHDALPTMRDVNYLIAIDTRYLGEAAAAAGDQHLVQLVFRFKNSYLRAALNAHDVRTSYHLLNQYRLLVEAMLRVRKGASALEGAKYMSYYGHLAYDMTLPFITETVAYDIAALCQCAHEIGAPQARPLLSLLLELDRPQGKCEPDGVLPGVRKAQAKLAAYYLMVGDEALAHVIRDDMADEPHERLIAVRDGLQSATVKEFWEITERGRNFEYLPEAQRSYLEPFFAMLGLAEYEPAADAEPPLAVDVAG